MRADIAITAVLDAIGASRAITPLELAAFVGLELCGRVGAALEVHGSWLIWDCATSRQTLHVAFGVARYLAAVFGAEHRIIDLVAAIVAHCAAIEPALV